VTGVIDLLPSKEFEGMGMGMGIHGAWQTRNDSLPFANAIPRMAKE